MTYPSKLFLWDDRSLYVGVLNKSARVVQPASSLMISLEGSFTVNSEKEEVIAKSALLKPGELHSINPGNQPFAICFLDALGQDYANLAEKMNYQCGPVLYGISNEFNYIETLTNIYHNERNSDDVFSMLKRLLLDGEYHCDFIIDNRIEKVIEIIRQNVDENLSAEQLAQSIDLSRPRLFQLFREQIGCPIRKYRLWHRIFHACKEISKTGNAVWSAQCAGFSDAAHFNRTFKRMLGVTPSELFNQENGIQVYCE